MGSITPDHLERIRELVKSAPAKEVRTMLQFALIGQACGIPPCCIMHFLGLHARDDVLEWATQTVHDGRVLCPKCR